MFGRLSVVTDRAGAAPRELEPEGQVPPAAERALALLRLRDFRRTYFAIAASELGDAFQYIALMWFALLAGGPLGVMAVRLADSIPALVFGFHGGVVADRTDRKRAMVAADLVRGLLLIPVAIAGLGGELPLWALVGAAFGLTAATSYFEPAYGALLPSLVGRTNVQQANGLVRSTAGALSVAGWGLGAALLIFTPISAFFLLNAASFFVSAALLARVRSTRELRQHEAFWPELRAGFRELRPRPVLAISVLAVAVGVTISSGTWIVGVPQLVRETLHRGAGSFSLLAAAYAVGSVTAGLVLARRPVRRKALASLAAWTAYLPAYGLFAFAGSLPLALAGSLVAGTGQSSALVLVNAAAQEDVPDRTLGRVLGLVVLVHRGAHATGLLFVAPLFALAAAPTVFAGAAVSLALVGIGGTALALVAARRR